MSSSITTSKAIAQCRTLLSDNAVTLPEVHVSVTRLTRCATAQSDRAVSKGGKSSHVPSTGSKISTEANAPQLSIPPTTTTWSEKRSPRRTTVAAKSLRAFRIGAGQPAGTRTSLCPLLSSSAKVDLSDMSIGTDACPGSW